MSILLSLCGLYLAIGLVPSLLATIVDDFWEKVLDGAQYDNPARHAAILEAFNDPSSIWQVALKWPLFFWMAARLHFIRGRVREIRADCDEKEEMVKEVPGGVLARELDHPQDCMLCRVDPRACRTLAVFHCGNVVDEGKASILSPSGQFAETRMVSRRGDKFLIYGEAPETMSETFQRTVLTNIVSGMSEEEAIKHAVLSVVTRRKG